MAKVQFNDLFEREVEPFASRIDALESSTLDVRAITAIDEEIIGNGSQSFLYTPFDVDDLLPILAWTNLTSATGRQSNRGVSSIDPLYSAMERSNMPVNSSFSNTYPTQPVLPTGFHSGWDSIWPAPWSHHFAVVKNWYEYWELKTQQYIDWLRPDWLDLTDLVPTGSRPMLMIQAPHGRMGAMPGQSNLAYRGEMSYFSALDCAFQSGLNHLVDGFFEGARRMKQLGVEIQYQIASPDTSFDSTRWPQEAKDLMRHLISYNKLSFHSDACVLYDEDSYTVENMWDLYDLGLGVYKESVVAPGSGHDAYWLSAEQRVFPYSVLYGAVGSGHFQDQCVHQQSWAITGGWEEIGTPEFDTLYGAEQRFIVMILGTEIPGNLYPSTIWSTYSGANEAAKKANMYTAFQAYLDILKDEIAYMQGNMTHIKVAMHTADILLCGMLVQAGITGYTAEDFDSGST